MGSTATELTLLSSRQPPGPVPQGQGHTQQVQQHRTLSPVRQGPGGVWRHRLPEETEAEWKVSVPMQQQQVPFQISSQVQQVQHPPSASDALITKPPVSLVAQFQKQRAVAAPVTSSPSSGTTGTTQSKGAPSAILPPSQQLLPEASSTHTEASVSLTDPSAAEVYGSTEARAVGHGLVLEAATVAPAAGMQMQQRSFNESDPFQVLDESLMVLDEIESMIKESLSLAAGLHLGQQGQGVLSQVPNELLDALEETITVILESRSECEELLSSRASSVRSHQSGRTARTARQPWHPSPYLQPAHGGSAWSRFGHSPTPSRQHSSTRSGEGSPASSRHHHHSPQGQGVAAVKQQLQSILGDTQLGSPTTPRRKQSAHLQARSQQQPGTPPSVRRAPGALGSPTVRPNCVFTSQGSPGQAVMYQLSPEPSSQSQEVHGSPSSSQYLYQRLHIKAAEEEARRKQILDSRPRRQGMLNSPHTAEWEASQQQRKGDEEQRRISQMQRDLQYIQQLRSREAEAQLQHDQALEGSHQALEELRELKARTGAAHKWISYQEQSTGP